MLASRRCEPASVARLACRTTLGTGPTSFAKWATDAVAKARASTLRGSGVSSAAAYGHRCDTGCMASVRPWVDAAHATPSSRLSSGPMRLSRM